MFRGVQILRSTELANWRQLDYKSLLDIRGGMDSYDTWAKCLSRDQNTFWLVNTLAKKRDETFSGRHNCITLTPSVYRTGSDSIYATSSSKSEPNAENNTIR